MSLRRGRAARLALAVLTGALVVAPMAPAAAAPEPALAPETYAGAAYSAAIPIPPTGSESQSKLWFHDQRWWGLFSENSGSSDVRVYQLLPDHSWSPTSALVAKNVIETGDAFEDDAGVVHVAVRSENGGLYYVPLTYDSTAHDYSAGTPALITTKGSKAPATIAKDKAGRLWIAYATAYDVNVAYSDDGRTWTVIMIADAGDGTTAEAAALIAYGNRLGLMWSDQGRDTFFFAWHRAGDPRPGSWRREVALSGPGQADNHISLVRVPTDGPDILAAAVKTSLGDEGGAADAPLIKVLVRGADGTWSETPVATVADGLNDPVLQADATTKTLHLLASVNGSIVEKRAPLDDIRFGSGLGDLFVLNNDGVLQLPTGSKAPVTDRSGLVVLASDTKSRTYRHGELPIAATTPPAPDPSDTIAPEKPTGLQARAPASDKALLFWEPATDRGGWFPAADGAPATSYVVFRDGIELATVATTTFTDRPRTEAQATDVMSVGYQVVAVDAAGNRSSPTPVTVELPAATSTNTAQRVGIAVLAAAVALGLYALRRLWVTQRPGPRRPPPPANQPARDAEVAGAAR
jgi:hypothetical protein